QVAEANPTKKLGPDTVRDGIDHLRAILRRVNVHPERSLAKGGIDHLDEPFEHLVRETRIGAGVVFSSPCLVGGRPSAAFAAKYGPARVEFRPPNYCSPPRSRDHAHASVTA